MKLARMVQHAVVLSAVTALCGCATSSELMRSARRDVSEGNGRRAVGTLDVELRREKPSSDAESLRREAAALWVSKSLAEAKAEGPARQFAVANYLAQELSKRQLDVGQAEVSSAITESLAGVWAEQVEPKVKDNQIEEAVAIGEALTEFAPPGAPQHEQLKALREQAAAKHAALLTQVPANLPGALLMHIRLARRYGVEWPTAEEDAAQVRADSFPAWKPVSIEPGKCGLLGEVLKSKLNAAPLFQSGLGPETTMTVSLSSCDSKVSRNWVTSQKMPYLNVTEINRTREDKSYKTQREGSFLVTYEVTKRTPYTERSVERREEMVEVHHVETEASARGEVTVRWGNQEIKRPIEARHSGESMNWKGQFVESGAYTVDMGAPLTSLAHQLWVKLGLAMSEANKAMSQALEDQAVAEAGKGQRFAAENLFMMASLMGRTLNGENREVGQATRAYLSTTYGITGFDSRTIMLGDPLQKPKAPALGGGKLPTPEADAEAIKKQRDADAQ